MSKYSHHKQRPGPHTTLNSTIMATLFLAYNPPLKWLTKETHALEISITTSLTQTGARDNKHVKVILVWAASDIGIGPHHDGSHFTNTEWSQRT